MYNLNLNEQEISVIAKAVMSLKITGKDAPLVAGVINKLQKQVKK